MSVSYNGNRIIPAPLVTINKSYLVSGDENKIGTRYNITMRGTILPFRGSPDSDGNFATSGPLPDETYAADPEGLNQIVRKQEAIRELFSENGKSLEWQAGGNPVVKCNPRVISIDFDEGIWSQRCDFTITFETERIYINGTTDEEDNFGYSNLTDASESWEFQPIEQWDDTAYNVTHTVNAQGIRGYDSTDGLVDDLEAWEHAKVWCDAQAVGIIDTNISEEMIDLEVSALSGITYNKTSVIDERGGSCTLTEIWLAATSKSLLEKSFSYAYDASNDSYNIQYTGQITGLGSTQSIKNINAKNSIPNNTTAKSDTESALSSQLGSLTLPDDPSNITIGIDEYNGTATFSFTWNFDPETQDFNAKITYTASQNYNESNDAWTITLSQDVEGTGADADEKVTNAKAAILTDSAALTMALSILDATSDMARGNPTEKSQSINTRAGTVRAGWSWKNKSTGDAGTHDIEVSVTTSSPVDVIAIIPIPGRSTGPIVQDMNTSTAERISVTLDGQQYDSDPGDLADAYGPGAGYYVVRNERKYNQISKQFNQTKEWVKGS
jgi:hypothetical protein